MHNAPSTATCAVPGCDAERAPRSAAGFCAEHVALCCRFVAWLLTLQPSDFGTPAAPVDRA